MHKWLQRLLLAQLWLLPVHAQTAPTEDLGKKLLQEIQTCALAKSATLNPEFFQECLTQITLLDAEGKSRPDGTDRLEAVLQATGVSLPKRVGTGQVTLKLQKVPDALVYTVPVYFSAKPERFLLDTGATNSILNSQIADSLKLTKIPLNKDLLKSLAAVGPNCTEPEFVRQSGIYPLPSVSVGPANVTKLLGIGFPALAIPGNLSGALGIDFLSAYDMILDPQKEQLALLPPTPTPPEAIPLVGRSGVLTAQVYLNDQGPFTFFLDTGADVSLVSERVAQKLALKTQADQRQELTGFCGTEYGLLTELKELRLGAARQKQVTAVVFRNDLFDLIGVDGLIGQNFLTQYAQHWRFGDLNGLGMVKSGSLILTPLQ